MSFGRMDWNGKTIDSNMKLFFMLRRYLLIVCMGVVMCRNVVAQQPVTHHRQPPELLLAVDSMRHSYLERETLMGFDAFFALGSGHLQFENSELIGKGKFNCMVGAGWRIRPLRNLELGMEAAYCSMGSGFTYLHSYRIHAIEIPLRLQYNTINTVVFGRHVKMGYFVSPYYRRLFHASIHNMVAEETTDWREVLQTQQYGLSVGVGYTMQHYILEYRYSFDFTPMLQSSYFPNRFARSYLICLGWMF